MKLSYEGIGQWAATFACDDLAEGELVKVSANGTVAACAAGDDLCGMVLYVGRGGDACAVALGGMVTAGYTVPAEGAAPALGWSGLSADGEGGVQADADGSTYLVVDVDTTAKTVTFEGVNFSYAPQHPVIRDFSLTVPSGKKVALVGATGSGKTTIVNLLLRFYDIDSGAIRINGQNIQPISRDSLRRDIAIVLQDTVLFSDTIRQNLLYGRDGATEDELRRALDMSHCREMLEGLPQGLDTVLAESGANISQGQRQLLAIARAFVADPKILILDEATSNVDTRTEKAIQDAMQLVMQNRTSIVIAHRLSTIRDSDLIVVMDQGRIAECGSHDALLEKKGKYYELYQTQYAGFAT